MWGMWIYRCLTFQEMFQGAHSLDMQSRGLLIQPLPKPPKPILQDKLKECGESEGGVAWEGEGRRSRRWEWDVCDSGYKSLDERNQNSLCCRKKPSKVDYYFITPYKSCPPWEWLMHKKYYRWNNPDSSYNIGFICSLRCFIDSVIWVIWKCVASAAIGWWSWGRKRPWLSDIPVSSLPQVGTSAAQEVYSFCVTIPQLE